MVLRIFFILLVLNLICGYAIGQTCCSAGAPVSTFLDIGDANEKSFSIQMNYEFKSINLLVDNNERLENDPRSRSGQSLSIKTDYTLNQKWAFSAILPLVYHSRKTFSETQNSIGIGDLSLLTQYKLLTSETQKLSISSGIKIPTGKVNHLGSSQIILSPDMQSGSGSFDLLLRGAYSKSDFLLPFMTGLASVIYRKNGTNDSFGKRDNFNGRSFAFGDEVIANVGVSYLSTLASGFLIPDLGIKVRWGSKNKEQGVDSPNSGGQWLSLPLGLSFVADDKKSIRLYTEIPVYQNLSGLQITTDFTFGVQFIYNNIGKKKSI